MNSCVLMAKIVNGPELRYTQEAQQPFTKMMLEFSTNQQNDQPTAVKAIAWGNLATEVQQNYHQGDTVIVVGRLSMNVVDLPEGYKEKRAELVISQMYLATDNSTPQAQASSDTTPSDKIAVNGSAKTTPGESASREPLGKSVNNVPEEPNLDDIPF